MAWAYLVALAAVILLQGVYLQRYNPALLAERAEFAPRQGVETWDLVLSGVARVSLLGILVVSGLDRRFGWTGGLPVGLQLAALLFGLAGGALIVWALVSNRNAAVYARLQEERGHSVATSGPYRFVRHPFYVGVLIYAFSIPLALGSLWALILSVLVATLFIIKTGKEDQMLRSDLDGYQAYADQVRYRLLPGIW